MGITEGTDMAIGDGIGAAEGIGTVEQNTRTSMTILQLLVLLCDHNQICVAWVETENYLFCFFCDFKLHILKGWQHVNLKFVKFK